MRADKDGRRRCAGGRQASLQKDTDSGADASRPASSPSRKRSPKESPRREPPSGPAVIGIGASAGGLEALRAFFRRVPENAGAAYVVVQHLSPDFESHMNELLGRETPLPIRVVRHGMRVAADTVYLMPPNSETILSGGRLLLTSKADRTFSFPIDAFFRSLAQEARERAVAVVLSGTGSDGARGALEVRRADGLVIAQDPRTAKFAGMPMSVQEQGAANLIARPEDMPDAIVRHLRKPKSAEREETSNERDSNRDGGSAEETSTGRILRLLRQEHGIDFSSYKATTVSRRIHRRLMLEGISSVGVYADRLASDSAELDALFRDLLIGVTAFFRDPDAFAALDQEVVRPLVESADDKPIRVWTAGCATGEEPYSLAILFHEAFERAGRRPNLKIFATDIHRESLRRAAQGIFSDDQLEHLSQERREKLFERTADGWRVASHLREPIIFAPHNLLSAAPFTRIDLVTCRNLLIYLEPAAQKRALSLFHFALRDKGALFLGPSESPGDLAGELVPINREWKIYRKRRDVRLAPEIGIPLDLGHAPGPTQAGFTLANDARVQPSKRTGGEHELFRAYDRLLDRYMPPSFLIDEQGALLHSFGGAESFLQVRAGRPSQNLADLIHPNLKASLAVAIQHVQRDDKPVRCTGIRVESDGSSRTVRLGAELFADTRSSLHHILVTLETAGAAPAADTGRAAAPADGATARDEVSASAANEEYTRSLEIELQLTRENLQATSEEMETSNEELQATNEELIASNEELQSSNEELHSVNEELYTVNSEYQQKIAELSEMTADMENLLSSTRVGVIFLDEDLRLRKFTPSAAEFFHLEPNDLGRRLDAFAQPIRYPGLIDDLKNALDNGERKEAEIAGPGDARLLVRLFPYEREGERGGVVLTLVDISSLRRAQSEIQTLSAIVESSDDAIVGLDLNGIITSWNPGAADLFGFPAEKAIGADIRDLITPHDRIDELEAALARARARRLRNHFRTKRRTADGRVLDVSVRMSPIVDRSGRVTGISAIDRDITREVANESRLNQLASIVASTSDLVAIADPTGRLLYLNPAGRSLLGIGPDSTLGEQDLASFHQGNVARRIRKEAMPAASRGEIWRSAATMRDSAGRRRQVSQLMGATFDPSGELEYYFTIIRDISDLARAHEEARRTESKAQRTARTLFGILQNLPDILFVVDANFDIEFASPEAEGILGAHDSEKNDLPLGIAPAVREVIESGQPYRPSDFRGVRPFHLETGETRFYLPRITPLRASSDEAVTGAVVSLQDVTEFRMLDQLKSNLIGTVSHELKTPVTSIRVGVGLMLEERVGPLTDKQRSLLETAGDDVERLIRTLQGLLDLNRFEESWGPGTSSPLSLREVAAAAVEEVASEARAAEITIRQDIPASIPAVNANRERLQHALVNLLSNAVRYSPSGETVTISAATAAPDRIEIAVRDRGSGIPPEYQEKIFTRFFRVPGSGQKGGTGLGLSIVREFIESQGGSVGVRSKPGSGAEFVVSLPAAAHRVKR